MGSLHETIERFAELDVLVVGDALLDTYLYGTTTGICREAPVPVVAVERRFAAPGGGANAAVNLAALGARTTFLSVVGDDADAGELCRALRTGGVSADDLLVQDGRRTVSKRRLIADDHMLARFDEGAPQALSVPVEDELLRRLRDRIAAGCDALVVSDYGYGVLTPRVRTLLAELHRGHPRVLVVDARSLDRYRNLDATAVKPNFEELRPFLPDAINHSADRVASVLSVADRLPAVLGAQVVAVTLDRDGAVVCERGRPPYRTYTRPISSSRASGAGDSFTSGLALALAAGADVPTAAEVASAAAAVVTGREGTSSCSADDLRQHVLGVTVRLENWLRLAERVAFHRRQGRQVVFTNGCFDLLHRGHIDFLNRAKALGDVLVVGLNSDASIRRLKGAGRPVNRLADRAGVLAALSCVDHLASFDGPTAAELVELLRPEIYAKGGDYTEVMVPEAPAVEGYGGIVRILPYLEDRSTSGIIERIRAVADIRTDGQLGSRGRP